jgi:Tfp pilus assembly protein PilX
VTLLRQEIKTMGQGKNNSRGFTLIAALLILVLLSGVAAGLLYMVTNESKMGGNDLEANQAYYGAESGMEKLTADLSALYTQYMIPTNAQIQNLVNYPPTPAMVSGMNYTETINYPLDANGNPASSWNTVSSGSNQGLYAEIIPMTMQVIANRPAGASVNITRKVEIALIPVFQFGVFCGYDCSYFPGPNFSFGGRVHTNQSLFLAAGGNLVFNDKIAAYQQVVMDQLENGHSTNSGYGGTVYVPKASGGCALNTFPPTAPNCVALPTAGTVPGDASWSGGYPGLTGATNPNFPSISTGTLNGFITNSLTGAKNMQLPFVQNSCTSNPPPCTDPISIIRKPLVGESPTGTLGSSRLYNKAAIRILLADTVADLHPERGVGALDADDVQFVPNTGTALANANAFNLGGGPVVGTEYYGMATVGANNWVTPTGYAWATYPILGELTTPAIPAGGQGAWLRVEYMDTGGAWHGITRDWLGYSFTRQYNLPPTGPATTAGQDPYNPRAILILQQMSPGAFAQAGAGTAGNFFPINFYDTREGEMRDNANGCAVNGIMNAVEINVSNLGKWLAGAAPYAGDVGKTVNYANQNGYILYFSDHRGMLTDPNPSNGGQTPAGIISGEAGLEDVVNSAAALTSTAPDGVKEAASYYTYSPEDVDQNGFLDNWGGKNIGYGFGVNTNTAPPNPYLVTACSTTGLTNMVSGARHVLKLVGGGMTAGTSYLPVRWDNGQGGFTVASENPVYVQGNYNSGASDPFWTGGTSATPHSAAAIIADAVTLLSNDWTDANSLNNPTTVNNRNANTTTYYRMAVAGGKNVPFPSPGFANAAGINDFGTDGGLHNFLRYLENWNTTLYYNGSLVSMYYSEYATGTFKCCTTVYSPPTRSYAFDIQFLNPANLPPGTPMFQDVVNLSYHQNFTPQ